MPRSQNITAIITIARNILKLFIHLPGLGNIFKIGGQIISAKYGRLNPNAIEEKIKNIVIGSDVIEKAIAVPKNGAVQGVENIVAIIPVTNEFKYTFSKFLFSSLDIRKLGNFIENLPSILLIKIVKMTHKMIKLSKT